MIYIIMGKSATGKDTVFSRLIADRELNLRRIIPYTTRPVRAGEAEGEEYHFVDEAALEDYTRKGKVIERRKYDTVFGAWYYFTVDDGSVRAGRDYLLIATLEAYSRIKEYYGRDFVTPIYIETDDYERLRRAMDRERSQDSPSYKEVCRRYIADERDFSEENLSRAGVAKRYANSDIEECVSAIKKDILADRSR